MLTRLPHTVTVQTETRKLFEGGAYTTSWATASTQWANVQPINANETYGQEKKQQITKYRVIMRYLSTLTNKNRLLFNNEIFVIETITDPTRHQRMIEVTCRVENL